jgi:hypothetical protein
MSTLATFCPGSFPMERCFGSTQRSVLFIFSWYYHVLPFSTLQGSDVDFFGSGNSTRVTRERIEPQ